MPDTLLCTLSLLYHLMLKSPQGHRFLVLSILQMKKHNYSLPKVTQLGHGQAGNGVQFCLSVSKAHTLIIVHCSVGCHYNSAYYNNYPYF